MKFRLALLALCLAGGALTLAGGTPTQADVAQPLSIRLHADGAQATRLPQYDPSLPIAVDVTDVGRQRLTDLTIIATGPAGENIQAPLVRANDGTFRGSLTLADLGSWRVHLSSRVGSLRTDTTAVTLDIESPTSSNAWVIGAAVGATIFIVIGGTGFLLLRRATRTPARSDLGPAV